MLMLVARLSHRHQTVSSASGVYANAVSTDTPRKEPRVSQAGSGALHTFFANAQPFAPAELAPKLQVELGRPSSCSPRFGLQCKLRYPVAAALVLGLVAAVVVSSTEIRSESDQWMASVSNAVLSQELANLGRITAFKAQQIASFVSRVSVVTQQLAQWSNGVLDGDLLEATWLQDASYFPSFSIAPTGGL